MNHMMLHQSRNKMTDNVFFKASFVGKIWTEQVAKHKISTPMILPALPRSTLIGLITTWFGAQALKPGNKRYMQLTKKAAVSQGMWHVCTHRSAGQQQSFRSQIKSVLLMRRSWYNYSRSASITTFANFEHPNLNKFFPCKYWFVSHHPKERWLWALKSILERITLIFDATTH